MKMNISFLAVLVLLIGTFAAVEGGADASGRMANFGKVVARQYTGRNDAVDDIINCASDLFGVQYGVFLGNSSRRLEVCRNFTAIDDRWAQTGIAVERVRRQVCNAVASPLTAPSIINAISSTVTCIFHVHAVKSGPPESDYVARLCGYLDDDLLDSMSILPGAHRSICSAAGLPVPPRSSSATIDPAAVEERLRWASLVFGLEAVVRYQDASEVREVCNNWSTYSPGLAILRLDEGLIRRLFCRENVIVVVTPERATSLLTTFTSLIFAIELINASQDEGYLEFLCETLDVDRMNALLLDGPTVKGRVCMETFRRG